MTDATVAEVASALRGRHLVLKRKDGTTDIEVGPPTPIVTVIPGDMSLLTPSARVFVVTTRQPDGSLVASRMTAKKNGVKPTDVREEPL